MPPKKAPSSAMMQETESLPLRPTLTNRLPLQAANLPPMETISPLWTPNSAPKDIFPEWTDPATLPEEYWGTVEKPFEDSLALENLLIPQELTEVNKAIVWMRPCQFLPIIADTPAVPLPLEPKSVVEKGAVSVPAKKADLASLKKLPPPKHAHVFVPKSEKTGRTTASSSALLSMAAADDQAVRIPRDFQRRWCGEQIEALKAWTKEEERIEREQEQYERAYMDFEDAIAQVVNERPRVVLEQADFDMDDLVDDGKDDEDEDSTPHMDDSNMTSSWGVLPPPRIEITPNTIYKPEIPHGEIIQGDMASYFRIVEQLYNSKSKCNSGSSSPFLWQAIYPQDSTSTPVYNPGGRYCVKLFIFGRWRRVDIDDKLPLDADGNVVYLASSMKNEIWPCLLVKALYKAAHWLRSTSPVSQSSSDSACQRVVQSILALTGWKVSRWKLSTNVSFSKNDFYELLQFMPMAQEADQVKEAIEGNNLDAHGADQAPQLVVETPSKRETTDSSKPRAIICATGVDEVADMVFGEVVLVTDVVGDTGSTTFKVVRQGSPATISEASNSVDNLAFLLVHPVLQFSDTFIHAPIPNSVKSAENSRAALVPFGIPRVQFVVVTAHEPALAHTPGDNSSESSQEPVNLVATLTPVHPLEDPGLGLDNLRKSSELMAVRLGVDPNGSAVLIEETETTSSSGPSLPTIVTLNSVFSESISVTLRDNRSKVYRVYPQKTLRYGYSLQIESDHKVAIQDAPTYWRSLPYLHVIECDGTYPVMLQKTWNILFKQSFELVPPTHESEEQRPSSPPELRIDLHLLEELLANFTHISIVNDATGQVSRVSTLCSKITLPATTDSVNDDQAHVSTAYTVIVGCAPGSFPVREGKWKLTLASDWNFAKLATHQVKMTTFEGAYESNNALLCFRDVIMAPTTSIWTTFQLQLLRNDVVANDLSAKLEVFDFATAQHPRIRAISSRGEVCLLQLPVVAGTEQSATSDKRRYIIQGSIDRSTCIVPDSLQSLRPFCCNSSRDQVARTSADENVPAEGLQERDLNASLAVPANHSAIKWRLNCWSSDQVELQEDNTKELEYEAIRASWMEKAVKRKSNGIVSRLLFLGQLDQAEAQMKQDKMTNEQIAKAKSRFEWVEGVTRKADGLYLERLASGDEILVSEQEFAQSRRLLLERIGLSQADTDQRQVARVLAKEQRADEVKNMTQAAIDKRVVFLQRQHELKRNLAAVPTPSSSSSSL